MNDIQKELKKVVSSLKGHLIFQRDVLLAEGVPVTPPNPLFDKEGVPKAGALSSCGCDSEQVPCNTQLAETSYKRVCVEGPVFDAEEVVWE
mgnify:CR=1 FL=1